MCLVFLSERAEHGAVGRRMALMGGVWRMRAHEGASRRTRTHQIECEIQFSQGFAMQY